MPDQTMMSERELSEWISQALFKDADLIVGRWLDWLVDHRGTRTVRSLPRNALLNHIPPVVRTIAQYVKTPLEAVQAEMIGHLRLHASVRRAQGYAIQELLAEFDGLARQIATYIEEKLEVHERSIRPRDAVEVLYRLSAGTRAIGFVTVGMYLESEDEFRERLAGELERFGEAIAHEIKTPLQTVQLGSAMIRKIGERLDESELLENVEIIASALKRIDDLLADVRVLALAQRTGRVRTLEAFRAVFYQISDELKLQGKAKDVEIKVGDPLPEHPVEKTIAQLCLINVISNAIKYADPDKPERWVHIEAGARKTPAGPRVVVRVLDNGVGIPGELLPQVFQRQFRAHPSLADGVGMGLSIIQQLLAEIGGDVQLESTEGEGTVVTITLPAQLPVPSADSVTTDLTSRAVMASALEDDEGSRRDS